MKCASSRTSAGEKFSSSAHFGIRAWICGANLVASPRCSRCASCCGRPRMVSALCADYAGASRLLSLAPLPHRLGQRVEQLHRVLPAEAGVGDALAEFQRLARLRGPGGLRPGATRPSRRRCAARRRRSARRCRRATSTWRWYCLAALACEQSIISRSASFALASSSQAACDAGGVVVRRLAAAQDDVAVLVAARLDDRHLAALVHREEMVLLARGEHRVDRDLARCRRCRS